MKALERALDVFVGKREYFEGEARTPGRGQELEEMEAGETAVEGVMYEKNVN